MRTILHCDMNNFYASVECLYTPALRGKPLAVCGDPSLRHGIVLAKNDAAKACGVCTGNPIWLARRLCPELQIVPPHYDRYLKISKIAREIYGEYTDLVEPFGLDECWLDISGSVGLFGDGITVARDIRTRIKAELGITASVGVSFNKVFAKLGSDIKKTDATTVIAPEGWEHTVYPLPVTDLLYVGPQTGRFLRRYYIRTIGDLAAVPTASIEKWLGKCGVVLQSYAKGMDSSPVSPAGVSPPLKSIGNSTTMPRDMEDGDDLRIILYILCESVAERLRQQDLQCGTVQLSLRGTDLLWNERQIRLPAPASNSQTIFSAAYRLYHQHVKGPLRSIGVRGCQLEHWGHAQTSLLDDIAGSQKMDNLERTVDDIRRRFGHTSIRRGIMLLDKELSTLNPLADHPNVFAGGNR